LCTTTAREQTEVNRHQRDLLEEFELHRHPSTATKPNWLRFAERFKFAKGQRNFRLLSRVHSSKIRPFDSFPCNSTQFD